MVKTFVRSENIRFRYEYFGGLCWYPGGEICQFSFDIISLIDLLKVPREYEELKNTLNLNEEITADFLKLVSEGILKEINLVPEKLSKGDILELTNKIDFHRKLTINKPFWVHIQPFKFCNQSCVHCYCNGGKNQSKFVLPLKTWKRIIDKLYEFGVMDVYVTGGENLAVIDCLELTEYIIDKGMGTGLSTNAFSISDTALEKLRRLNLEAIQVSLDSVDKDNYDFIRGTSNGLKNVLSGLKKIMEISEPIINIVVTQHNIDEIEEIIKYCSKLNITKFKIFPVKNCGRAAINEKCLLKLNDIKKLSISTFELSTKYRVDIESVKIEEPCGSGFSGFSINENGNVFPCVFGMEKSNHKIGNILQDDIENIWFRSEKLERFRKLEAGHPCNRCERDDW